MPHFEVLGSLIRDLHLEFQRIYYLMLPVFFCLSLSTCRSMRGCVYISIS